MVTAASPSARAQLASFIRKYSPRVAADGRAVLTTMRRLLPGSTQFVYDNFQWLVVGFGPNDRPSDAVFSIVFTPKWITLCFLQDGSTLADPRHLLKGSGNVVRSVRLSSPRDLDTPALRAVIREAILRDWGPLRRSRRGPLLIRAIAKRQRPRRPATETVRRTTPRPSSKK